jgi:hypothetical protein
MGEDEMSEDEFRTVSFRWKQEKIDAFDDKILEMKYEGELDRDTTRTDVIRQLLDEWIGESNE